MSRTAEPVESASVARVREDAARRGLTLEIRRMDNARSALDAAAACGCAVGQIVKSIVFRVEGSDRHVLFLTAGDARVDAARAAALVGAPLVKADAAGIRAHTGFAIGGVSPFGHVTPIDTWFDPGLLAHATVWAAAGTPQHVFAVAPDRLVAATGATVADFVEPA